MGSVRGGLSIATPTNQALTWAETVLTQQGYTITAPTVLVRAMSWSQVSRIFTEQGVLYLKVMAPAFANEPNVLRAISAQQQGIIPHVIAENAELHCFIMQDAGDPLRELLQQHYDAAIVCQVLSTYARLQRGMAESVPTLLTENIPDWRLNCLPELYTQLLNNTPLMEAEGIGADERAKLHAQKNIVADLCAQLTGFSIPETIEHSDFHDNNILVKDGKTTLNDWGDTMISHPFFSLTTYLSSLTRIHSITPEDARYQQVQAAYLNVWQEQHPNTDILSAYQITLRLHPLRFALNFSRIFVDTADSDTTQYRGRIGESLRGFATAQALQN